MRLKEYQFEAISRLKEDLTKAIKNKTEKICIFQAPTGSGKTITTAHLLKTMVNERITSRPLSFIWVSVGKLHIQSKDKLEMIYNNTCELQCSHFDDLSGNMVQENEIWFINWEKINRIEKNVIVRDNETEKYLDKIIQNTKEAGRHIILIIDESHHSAQSEHAQKLVSMINPDAILEVSATPVLKPSLFHKTGIDQVRQEEMIKNDVLINPKIDREAINETSATDLVINQSIKKQAELKEMYRIEGSNINPLILVQLPQARRGMDDKKEEIIELYKKYGKTVDNAKLAIWLSEDKTPNLSNIEKNDSDVDVLLFKQAIAIGWDCPRASILVVFRENKGLTFTIQVIGRIMRMPEQRHYTKHGELNSGYIFTNLENIDLAREYVEGYASMYHSERDDGLYTPVMLHSTYLKRQREKTRLSGKFQKMFDSAATETKLKDRINMSVVKISRPMIINGIIKDIDQEISNETSISADGSFCFNISDVEIQNWFNTFILDMCRPYAPYDSSDRLKTALYNWLHTNFGIEKLSTNAQIKILSSKNIDLFRNTIEIAKQKYSIQVTKNLDNTRERIENTQWEVPAIQSVAVAEEHGHHKYVMKPAYINPDSDIEQRFMKKLESEEISGSVKWWYKNGTREVKYFAIPYTDQFGMEWSFYVDFIIGFSDGSVGLFDTKGYGTVEGAKYKAEALAKYIKKHSSKKRPLFGGIVIEKNGTWLYNDSHTYEYNPKDLSRWKPFVGSF